MNAAVTQSSAGVNCYLCGSSEYREVLRKGPIFIFTDSPDEHGLRRKYACELNQCACCGHVFEPIGPQLRELLREVYQSADAQGPSPVGFGSWGMARADRLFFAAVDLRGRESAVEIGCGDGYLLKELRGKGFKRLTGIEPSVNVGKRAEDGIIFINEFIDAHLRLEAPVDLAYSIAVFEHIESINGVLQFCRNNLQENGELFFVVPNAQWQLESGDPGLFIHQHVHCFTASSVDYLLRRNGFRSTAVVPTAEGLQVHARKGEPASDLPRPIKFYDDYQPRLERILERLRALLATQRVVVHGACNALNNVYGWIGGRFELADNDPGKLGKTYFGARVKSPAQLDLAAWDAVVIIATAYFEQISADYRARGFRGAIIRLDA